MSAILLRRQYIPIDDKSAVHIVIWEVDPAVLASQHCYKYRLAYVHSERCVLRYDNEAGKGDHKHIGSKEYAIVFTSIEQLVNDFMDDVMMLKGVIQ